jgi:hypothetical protein
MRSRLPLVLVLGVAGVVVFAAGTAIGSSKPPVTYNSVGEPVIKSPNGQFSITVGNAGIELSGPGGKTTLSATSLTVMVPYLNLRAGMSTSIGGQTGITLRAGTLISLQAGTNVQLNGCAQPVVRGTDTVLVSGSTGKIIPGQQAVCMG